MSVVIFVITFVIVAALFWWIFTSINKNQLPRRTDFTPYDDIMSGRVKRDPLHSFMNQDDEKEK
jgi:thiosulfate reductase cytochrome b subunit